MGVKNGRGRPADGESGRHAGDRSGDGSSGRSGGRQGGGVRGEGSRNMAEAHAHGAQGRKARGGESGRPAGDRSGDGSGGRSGGRQGGGARGEGAQGHETRGREARNMPARGEGSRNMAEARAHGAQGRKARGGESGRPAGGGAGGRSGNSSGVGPARKALLALARAVSRAVSRATAALAEKARPATRAVSRAAAMLTEKARPAITWIVTVLVEKLLSWITWAAAFMTMGALVFIVGFICARGIPHIRPSLFALEYNSVNVSLTPALIATFVMAFMALAAAVPLGVFAAIYLTEYASRGNRAVALVRMTAETLSGIPSIVYGLFGSLFFVVFLGWGYSVLAGACTLSIMILPLVMRSAEEAIKAVPDTFREGSFGLGAGKLRTVFRIVLPSAAPGILAGVILSVGRIVGETAALIYTAGTVAQIPSSPMLSAETLSVHMYRLSSEGLHTNEAYATAVVLLAVTAAINFASGRIARRLGAE